MNKDFEMSLRFANGDYRILAIEAVYSKVYNTGKDTWEWNERPDAAHWYEENPADYKQKEKLLEFVFDDVEIKPFIYTPDYYESDEVNPAMEITCYYDAGDNYEDKKYVYWWHFIPNNSEYAAVVKFATLGNAFVKRMNPVDTEWKEE